MREYNYSDIVEFSKTGILFSDGVFVNFEECRHNWAQENNIPVEDTVCVALRFSEGADQYFEFCATEKVKVHFVSKGIFKKRNSRNTFRELQVLINQYGYTSYDKT